MEMNATTQQSERAPVCKSALIRALILLVVSVMLFGFAFLPIGKIDKEMDELISSSSSSAVSIPLELSMDFNLIDAYIFAFDSMRSGNYTLQDLQSENIEDSDLMDRLSILKEEITSIDPTTLLLGGIDSIKEEYEDLFAEASYISLRLGLQSKETPFSVSLFATACLGTLYLLTTAAFFVFALLHFLRVLRGGKGFEQIAISLLCALPGVMLGLIVAFYTSMSINVVGVGAMIGILLSVGAIVAVGVLGAGKGHKRTLRGILSRAGVMAVAVVLVLMCLTPMITMGITAQYDMRSKDTEANFRLDASVYEELNITTDQYKILRESLAAEYSALQGVTKTAFEEGDMQVVANDIFKVGMLCASKGKGLNYLSLTVLPMFLMLITAAMVIWQTLCYLATGRDIKRVVTIARAITMGLAIAFLALNIVLICIGNSGVSGTPLEAVHTGTTMRYLDTVVSFGMGMGSIAILILAIGMFVIPYRKNGKKETAADDVNLDQVAAWMNMLSGISAQNSVTAEDAE